MPRNQNEELNNPCLQEHKLSLKCLSDNNYDRSVCELYFANYNNCKEFWNKIKSQRRAQGITPYLPPVEERAAYKEKHQATRPKSN